MVTIEHECVDEGQVARLVVQRTRVVLEAEVRVPDDDTVQTHRVFAGVHETEGHVVSAHEDGKRIVAGDVDRERGVPPRGVVEGNLGCIGDRHLAMTQVVLATERLQRVDAAERVLAPRLELQPRALLAQHRPVHAQLRILGVAEERHRAHERFGLEGDVVVHEQHVRRPAGLAEFHQSACESAGTAEVAVLHHTERGIRGRTEGDVACVVDDEHAHLVAQRLDGRLEVEHGMHGLAHIVLAVERGDRQRETNVAGDGITRSPLPARRTHLAGRRPHAHEVRAVPRSLHVRHAQLDCGW